MSLSITATDLRQRVLLCLNKLSDRDTLPLASAELESIARSLTRELFSTFLSCLAAVDSAEKPPVRRQCVRIVGVLADVHGDFLSAYVAKMLAVVLHRVRDSDSAVRSACVDSVSSMASKISLGFSSFLKPLVNTVLHEQDHNSQMGSALCLAAAIEAAPDPEPAQLQKLLPKLLKLVTKDCFKAKAALLSLIGNIASAGGATNHNTLSSLISCLVHFLSSEDWAARKAAVEAMSRLAVAERGKLTEFRAFCLASLENRRFDKVKIVRDTMNRTLEVWKEVPEMVSFQSQCQSSSKEDSTVTRSPPLSRSSSSDKFVTPKSKKIYSTSRSLSSGNSLATTTQRRSPSVNSEQNPKKISFSKTEFKDSEGLYADDLKDGGVGHINIDTEKRNSILKSETRRTLFRKNFDGKSHTFGSRVVSFSDVLRFDDGWDFDVNQKEVEELNLIRKQLVQIENQQYNLLELLQRFMGNSRRGINQLENRVNDLEKALDEIFQDLAVSTGGISNSAQSSCCRIPGAEFSNLKFRKRAESRFSYASFSLSKRNHSLSVTHPNAEMHNDSLLQNDRINLQEKLEKFSNENGKTRSYHHVMLVA